MDSQKLPCITLNRHADKRAGLGHPWVFSNELADSKHVQGLAAGEFAEVLDCRGNYLGTGFVQPKSLITVRILTRKRDLAINEEFFFQKIRKAVAIREALYGRHTGFGSTYRAVFGESDGLPGLIVDRFQGAWVIEPHAFGVYHRLEWILSALRRVHIENFPTEKFAVALRTDHRANASEGIEERNEWLTEEKPTEAFALEDGIAFPVDPIRGQKTGFFFDQRDNRTFFSQWIAGRQKEVVLDLFCHLGGWGLRALKAGAEKVVFVDRSKDSLEKISAIATKMGAKDRIQCVESDVSEFLATQKKQSFSSIILDPPALIPSKKSLAPGTKNYLALNEGALKLLKIGGGFSSSSCSYHLEEGRLCEIIHRSLHTNGLQARVLRQSHMSADHPHRLEMPEGNYLKQIFVVTEELGT